MKEIKCKQGTDEWKNMRCGKITGSNFGNIVNTPKQRDFPFNKTQLDYLYSVAAEIFTGTTEDDFQSFDMMRGNELEPVARNAYSAKHLTTVRECGFYTDDMFIGVSPDGVIGDNEIAFEIKCPKAKTHVKYMLNPQLLFDTYKWQIIGEAYAIGTKKAIIISFHPDFPEDKQIVEYEYLIPDEEIKLLEDRLILAENLLKEWVTDAPIQVDF